MRSSGGGGGGGPARRTSSISYMGPPFMLPVSLYYHRSARISPHVVGHRMPRPRFRCISAVSSLTLIPPQPERHFALSAVPDHYANICSLTSQGSAHGRFTRAIQHRKLWAAEISIRELGNVSLEDALGYLDLLAEQKPEKLERAAVRWHGRLETESTFLSLAEPQLALAAQASLCAGERDAVEVLRRLLRRVRPTVPARIV